MSSSHIFWLPQGADRKGNLHGGKKAGNAENPFRRGVRNTGLGRWRSRVWMKSQQMLILVETRVLSPSGSSQRFCLFVCLTNTFLLSFFPHSLPSFPPKVDLSLDGTGPRTALYPEARQLSLGKVNSQRGIS